jgi:phospholipid/cholesterol/gamma-HCH transport system substrate-binding protein
VNYPLVGLFVLVLGAVLVAIVLWLASGGAFRQKFDLYLAVSDESVAGLNLNAPVKYNGVDVGQVRDIRLDPGNQERVNLLFAIEQGTPIKEDTVAVLKIQGLTGIAYVELSGGTRDSPLLRATAGARYPVIPTKPSLSARLENVLTNVLAKLDSTSSSINAILSDQNKAAFTSALADIAAVSRTIAARKESLDAAIASAARAAAQAGPVLERIERAAASVEKMGVEVARTSASAGKTVDSVGLDLTRFTSETLPELELLLGELSVLSASLRRLTDQTERNPSGLLFGRTAMPAGPGESLNGAKQP